MLYAGVARMTEGTCRPLELAVERLHLPCHWRDSSDPRRGPHLLGIVRKECQKSPTKVRNLRTLESKCLGSSVETSKAAGSQSETLEPQSSPLCSISLALKPAWYLSLGVVARSLHLCMQQPKMLHNPRP